MFSYCPRTTVNRQQLTINNKLSTNNLGFTLIELIITIIIAGILFGIGIAYFNANNKHQTLINTANEVKDKMRLLQSYANSNITRSLSGTVCTFPYPKFDSLFIEFVDLSQNYVTGITCLDLSGVGLRYYDPYVIFPSGIKTTNAVICSLDFVGTMIENGYGGGCPAPPIPITLTDISIGQSKTICISSSGSIYDGNPSC